MGDEKLLNVVYSLGEYFHEFTTLSLYVFFLWQTSLKIL